MTAPSDKSSSVFAASRTGLVQLTTKGDVYAMAFSPDNDGANAQATWQRIKTPALNITQQIAMSNGTATDKAKTPAETSGSGSKESGGGTRRALLSWGMTVVGLALSAIGFIAF